MTPAEPGGASRMMQAIGRRYVACFNARYQRTGTLWEGRFESALVDSSAYVFTCIAISNSTPCAPPCAAHQAITSGAAITPTRLAGMSRDCTPTPHGPHLARRTNGAASAIAN